MITERLEVGKMEIFPDGQIQLREDTVIERDSVEIARLYHRRVLEPVLDPPDDVKNHPDTRVSEVVAILWTSDVVKAYEDKKKAIQPIGEPAEAVPVDDGGQKVSSVVN